MYDIRVLTDDECDLDTLSALLEEEDSDDHISAQGALQQSSVPADAAEGSRTVEVNGESFADSSPNTGPAEDEMDMETLSFMLDQDSDLEDTCSQQEQRVPEAVSADDIAAFFNESSDSENDGEREDKGSSNDTNGQTLSGCGFEPEDKSSAAMDSNPAKHGSPVADSGISNDSDTQQDTQHVKQLQDELALMQQRMAEIQQMLASQTPTATAAATTTTPQSATRLSGSLKHQSKQTGKLFMFNSDRTKKEQAPTINPSESKGVGKSAARQDSQEVSGGSKKKKKASASTFLVDAAESRGEVSSSSRESLKRSLFGEEDSNSDWDDEEGDKAQLSNGGLEIKRLLVQGKRQRQAHTPSYSLPSAAAATTWKSKAPSSTVSGGALSVDPPRSSPSSSSSTSGVRKEPETRDYTTEKFSGLRIITPKVSSVMLATKMEGRRMIPVSRLHLKVNTADLQGDWVTIGIIVQKSEARKSQTGKTYSIWKVSDLEDPDRPVSFFLFGQVYKQLWKMDMGTVIGLLNPSIMDSMEKGRGDVAFTVSSAQQVMEIGRSKDLGWCTSKTKRGTACTNIVNKKLGDFCTYHVQAAYRKQSSKRSELHGSCPGTTPKSSLKSKILQNNTFFYGGECYVSAQGKGKGGGKKDKVTLSRLQGMVTQQDQSKVNTLAIQNLLPSHTARVQSSLTSQHQRPFLDMLSVPSVGSMNLVKHIATAEEKMQDAKKLVKGGVVAPAFQSINATDLLKQHRQQIAERISSRRQQQQTASQQNGHQPQPKSSSGQTHSKKSPALPQSGHSHSKTSGQPHSKTSGQPHSKNSEQPHSKNSSQSKKSPGVSQSVNSGPSHSKASGQQSKNSRKQHSEHSGQLQSKNSGKLQSQSRGQRVQSESPQVCETSPGDRGLQVCEASSADRRLQVPASGEGTSGGTNPLRNVTGAVSATPMLGKGFYPGSKVDLFAESAGSSRRKPTAGDAAKKKAILKVHAMGGLEKKDPNAVRPTTENTEKVRKRVMENIENEHTVTMENGDGDRLSASAEPARKKSRLLGNVDPNSDEVKQLLSARSSHTGALAQAEADREERYFDNLELKEKMEEKMKSVTCMEVSVVTCEQCKYTAMSQSERCKQERHTVRRHKGKRRFFACKKCKHRTVCLHRYPTTPCKKCGEHSYEKTSMHQEKTGPKLESEILCLRGDESKYLNAMDQKVFLSTVVQD
ncbi:hypothetical protein ACOMHN_053353 [Nucella lapillus]